MIHPSSFTNHIKTYQCSNLVSIYIIYMCILFMCINIIYTCKAICSGLTFRFVNIYNFVSFCFSISENTYVFQLSDNFVSLWGTWWTRDTESTGFCHNPALWVSLDQHPWWVAFAYSLESSHSCHTARPELRGESPAYLEKHWTMFLNQLFQGKVLTYLWQSL